MRRTIVNKAYKKARGIIPEQIEHTFEEGFEKSGGFFNEFKKFAVKGNVIDLAVGIIIGAAFTSIVNSLVNDIIMPAIGLITGNIDFSDYYINLTGTEYATLAEAKQAGAAVIQYGQFLNNVINFLIVAFVVFLMVKWINSLQKKEEAKPVEKKKNVKKCPFCFEEVNINATKCKFCTSQIPFVKEKSDVKARTKEEKQPKTFIEDEE